MSADLIGYMLFIPNKKAGEILKEHTRKLKNLVNPTNSVKFIKSLKGEKKINLEKELTKLNISWDEYTHGEMEDFNDPKQREKVLDRIRCEVEELDNITMEDVWSGRDSSTRDVTINKCAVTTIFAGEMTYGDEPSGGGYQVLKLLCNLGVDTAWHNAIPWNGSKR
jgi:hypothetical protein